MTFSPVTLTPEELQLRAEIRVFLAETLPPGSYRPALGMSGARSREFTKMLADKGWVGTSIPERYSGHQRSAVERFILAEELFSAGAPVSGHWVGERQTAPMLLAFGTEAQKARFLPAISRGEAWFSIGMSEPDAGSDLASVKAAARRTEGGWSLTGTKIWTSGAEENDFFVVLCRTSALGEDRHVGLSQLIVDLRSPGIEISPIVTLDGATHFYEVAMHEVFVPDEMVLGTVGEGWRQVNSELGFERSGPERFLSPYQLLRSFVSEVAPLSDDPETRRAVGRFTAMFWVLRNMSLSLARSIDAGHPPGVEAAIVKDVGTTFEQSVVSTIQTLVEVAPDLRSRDGFESLLAESVLMSPAWTIRGGTTEVLRTVASRSLAKRTARQSDNPLVDAVSRVLADNGAPPVSGAETVLDDRCWKALTDAGFAWVGVSESSGGEGGGTEDACSVTSTVARYGVSCPIAETGLVAGWALSSCGMPVDRVAATVGTTGSVTVEQAGDELTVNLSLERVPWADRVPVVVVPFKDRGRWLVARVPTERLEIFPGANIAGESRCAVRAERLRLSSDDVAVAPEGFDLRSIELRGALARTVAMGGAMERVSEITVAYAADRRQFGRTINSFQAVQHHLVRMASHSAVASMAAQLAAGSYDQEDHEFAVAAAKIVAGHAASVVTAAAHQVHGAIGMTMEYPLHRYTRSLWAWSQEFGSSRYWSGVVGSKLVDAGVDALWPRITSTGVVGR
ncbi:MAG: acyl-CoA dehydrogenase family protein [Acidimicrobiales bacterium]